MTKDDLIERLFSLFSCEDVDNMNETDLMRAKTLYDQAVPPKMSELGRRVIIDQCLKYVGLELLEEWINSNAAEGKETR